MTVRVLSIDGGGMRGIYTATYLDALEQAFCHGSDVTTGLDIGKAFDLIVGTSTGAIIAGGLAKGVTPAKLATLYMEHGQEIFRKKLPTRIGLGFLMLHMTRRSDLELGNDSLREALTEIFESMTIRELWDQRKIALAIPSVNMGTYRSWVFKTPHIAGTNHRDDGYTLVDVCLASSAAPLFRSLAAIKRPASEVTEIFADGGLWANNPVLVSLIEALRMSADRDDDIEIFSLGTCCKPEGADIAPEEVHRGLFEWKLGGEAATVSIAAQEFAFDFMARSLVPHLRRTIRILRFPTAKVPAAILKYLDLDETRQEGLSALMRQARSDADMTNSEIQNESGVGKTIKALFESMPHRTVQEEANV